MFQFTSGLCLTNQLYPRNMSVPFKSVTATSICSLCLLILTSSSAYHVISLFLVPSALNTSNDLSISLVLIFSFFTSCLLIPIYVYPESTSTYSCSSFPFNVLTFICMLSSLSLSFLQFRIIYWFWALVLWIKAQRVKQWNNSCIE